MSEQTEAWTRKKPKRIIQNQTLIQLLMVLPSVGGLSMFLLVFCVAPVIVIPSILVVWAVGSVSYVVIWLHVERQNKKGSHI